MKLFSNKYFFLVIILTALLFTACKKYPEDKFAFRTVKARLEAEWQIEKIEINGSDVSNLYNDSLAPLSLNNFYFWFVYNKLAPNPNKDDTRDLFLINKSSKSYKDAYNNNDVAIGYFGYDNKKESLTTWLEKKQTKDTVLAKTFKQLLESYSYKENYYIQSLYHKTLITQRLKNNSTYRIYFKRTQR